MDPSERMPFAQVPRPAPKVQLMPLRREASSSMGARRLHDKRATVPYPLALAQGSFEDGQEGDIMALRPGAADVVFSLKWKDLRVSALMPDGLKELSLSARQA